MKVKTAEAKRMLDLWKDAYFEVRAKIESSGRDSRWEFDRKKLFERTDYMAQICQDLYDVAQVSDKILICKILSAFNNDLICWDGCVM